jgi:predicted RecA/RadA family phage recombinase
MADMDFRLLNPDAALKVRYTNNHATADFEEGDLVYLSAGVMTKAIDNLQADVLGVLAADVENGDQVDVYVTGVFEATVSGSLNFAQGEAVYSAGSGLVDKGTALDHAIGYIVDLDPASGATTVKFFLRSAHFTALTHA